MRFQLLFAELEGVELVVPALVVEELLVGALLQDLPVAEHNDVVRVLDGGEPVGHNEHGADVLHLLQGILNEDLGLGVDVGGSLVQDHDLRPVYDGPGKGKQLPLPRREVVAPLPDHLVQAAVQLVYERVGVHIPAGLPHLLVGV